MTEAKARLSFADLPVGTDRTAAYRLLHDIGPVGQLRDGGFVVTTRRCAEYVLRHPEQFSSRLAFAGVGSPLPMVPIEFDPPEHTHYRRLLQSFFSPRAVLTMRDEIAAIVRGLVDRFASSGRCDFVTDLAAPLSAEAFLVFFGLPQEERDSLIAWKEALSGPAVVNGGEKPPEQAARGGEQLYAFLKSHLAHLRTEPGGQGFLAELLAGPHGVLLSDEELLGMSIQFVLAGLDTVTSALSNSFAILAEQPSLRRLVTDTPDRIPDVVEELLRLDGPVFVVPRVAVDDVQLEGVPIPAGSRVFVSVAAANRDPSISGSPDDVQFDRERAHIAFGVGPHRCVGSHLARLELRTAFEEWHRRIPEYWLAPGTEQRAPWPNGLVGVRPLFLEFSPSGGHNAIEHRS